MAQFRSSHLPTGPHPPLRLAEVMAALSQATDLGMGQPLDFALRGCLVAMRLAEALGFDEQARREVYYQALLRYIGCNAETHLAAAMAGDELVLRSKAIAADTTNPREAIGLLLQAIRQTHAGASPVELAGAMAGRPSIAIKEGQMTECLIVASFAFRSIASHENGGGVGLPYGEALRGALAEKFDLTPDEGKALGGQLGYIFGEFVTDPRSRVSGTNYGPTYSAAKAVEAAIARVPGLP